MQTTAIIYPCVGPSGAARVSAGVMPPRKRERSLRSDMELRPARKGRSSIDVLRFAASLFILIFHAAPRAPVDGSKALPILSQGWIATDFFILLSGFIMSRAYSSLLASGRLGFAAFMAKRFKRIYPSHLVALALFAVAVLAALGLGVGSPDEDTFSVPSFVAQVLLLHAVVYADLSWNVPTWTLSALFICYALLAVYARWLVPLRSTQLVVLSVLVLGAGFLIAYAVTSDSLVDQHHAFRLLRAIPLFIIGSLLDRISAPLEIGARAYSGCLGAALAAVVLLNWDERSLATDALSIVALSAALVLSGSVRLPESVVTKRMGGMSYSLFLTHTITLTVWAPLSGLVPLDGDGAGWVLWVGSLAACLAAAAVFELLVDKPLSSRFAKRPAREILGSVVAPLRSGRGPRSDRHARRPGNARPSVPTQLRTDPSRDVPR